MYIKAEFILEIEADLANEAITNFINNIFENGENISDYAFIYTRRNEKENWKEVK